jgi:CBS-domain-containing membrane protein
MNSAIERLLGLRVSDIMSKDVVDVSPHETMEQAAGSLASKELSAAPVVDAQGHCVGILSATDFLLARGGTEATELAYLGSRGETPAQESSKAPFAVTDVRADKVEAHMSHALQTIASEDSLIEAARRMCGMHVHRMPVLDTQGHVLGMVSSLDIAAALVKVIEE